MGNAHNVRATYIVYIHMYDVILRGKLGVVYRLQEMAAEIWKQGTQVDEGDFRQILCN